MNVRATPVPHAPYASVGPGDIVGGKYRVERVLGEGGMGVVVAAINEGLGQRVAIKLLRPAALLHLEALERFEREARAAASLRSEHVARALDVGKLPDGRPFLVMEYLEGQDLGDVIDKEPPLAIATAVDYVLQACEAVAEAHSQRIIHRDLKPRNLFLTRTVDGRPLVKVLDFGISKFEDGQDLQLTSTTEIIGSPSYMSPEQLKSSKFVDTRTDIWALGVILYELLSKHLPFSAGSVTELIAVVLMENAVPVTAHRPDIPPGLSDIIGMCLAKNLDHRIQTVAHLASLLEPYGGGNATSAADRVRGVAISSGRSVAPPAASSSARVHVHAGTAVAWGETQVDAPPKKRGFAFGLVMLGLGGALFLALFAVGIHRFINDGARAPASSGGIASGTPQPLPPTNPAAAPAATTPPAASSILFGGRDVPAPTSSARTDGPRPRPAAGGPKPDDLSDVGRR